jgi:hypothetical protein
VIDLFVSVYGTTFAMSLSLCRGLGADTVLSFQSPYNEALTDKYCVFGKHLVLDPARFRSNSQKQRFEPKTFSRAKKMETNGLNLAKAWVDERKISA